MKLHMHSYRFWLAVCSLIVFAAQAGNVSALEAECFLDNGDVPSLRVAASGVAIEVSLPHSGDVLYVDGTVAATASADGQVYVLPGGDSARSFWLLLKSGGETFSRFVTTVPYAGFSCSIHGLELSGMRLDSRPAGTVRRMRKDAEMDIAWSGIWSAGATGSEVAVYSGPDASGTPLAMLVESEGAAEGTFRFFPGAFSMGAGVYTLTHYDGVETLVSRLRLTRGTFMLSFR